MNPALPKRVKEGRFFIWSYLYLRTVPVIGRAG